MKTLGQLAVLVVFGVALLAALGYNPVAVVGDVAVDVGTWIYDWLVGGLADSLTFW